MKQIPVLFDLDGTLIDSFEGIKNCAEYAAQKLNADTSAVDFTRFIGPPLTESFEKYMGFSNEKAKLAVQIYRERYSTLGVYEYKVYEGINDMLKFLKEKNFALFIATGKPEKFAKLIAKNSGFDKYISDTTGSLFTGERVHKNEVIEEVFNRFPLLDREKGIMVGDRSTDITGAEECRIRGLGVAWGFAGENELQNAKAEFIAETPKILADYIAKTV